ncbi:MAG: hypothetical protein M1821_002664 [Bathelium mastoideum]|nr:MAG: hypothetical protein M1821_002664 [Bathelium mastoideum]
MERSLKIYLLAAIFVALLGLYDYFTERIPSRLRADQSPKSGYGLIPAMDHDSLARAHGTDIVFVHGLGSNPDTTWQAEQPVDAFKTADTNTRSAHRQYVNWVSEFLPIDLASTSQKDIRIYFYNYDSYWKRDAIRTRLRNLGNELLEHITKIRQSEQERSRNLVLVGYSYGGLVVKQALVQAHMSQDPDHIAKYIKGIVFLGTPHRGSSFSTLGWLAALGLQPLGSNPSLIAEVEYDSIPLLDLHRHFVKVISSDVIVVNFFEQRPSLILKLWFYRWQRLCVNEQSATYEGSNVRNIGLNVEHTGLNKFGSRDHNYKLILSKLSNITNMRSQPISRHYVVPIESVRTYTERHELSQSLHEKMKVRHNDAGVLHAAVVYGSGGTGKSQLALRYAEGHKQQYNPILWIDATNADTARSSYERIAEELGIVLDSNNSRASSLNDSKAVPAVLRWLFSRGETDDEWLVIIDNADDVRWDPRAIVPKGERGNIIITSRDRLVPIPFNGSFEELEVGVMSTIEATSLLLQHLHWDSESAPENIVQSCTELVQQLGCLALAVDLAGAHISNEPNQEVALRQYLADRERHQDDLLESSHLYGLQTEDTVWTVSDTTLNKLKRDHPMLQPPLMFAFFARFKGSVILDKMFRLAGLGISAVNQALDGERLLSDIRKFLQLDGGKWDNSSYRQSRGLLARHSLLQRVTDKWPWVTMHNLVQRRAKQYEKSRRWDWWSAIFVRAVNHHLA